MSRILECINLQAPNGLSPESQRIWEQIYNPKYEFFRQTMADETAARFAAQDAIAGLRLELDYQKWEMLQMKAKRAEHLDNIDKFAKENIQHKVSPMSAYLMRMVEHFGWKTGAPTSPLGIRAQQNLGSFQNMMIGLIEEGNKKINPTNWAPQRALMQNVGDAIFGKSVDDLRAQSFAKSWHEVKEYIRQRENILGMRHSKNDEWHLPQTHIWENIHLGSDDIPAAKKAWIAFHMPLLDRERMIDKATGAKFTDERLLEALQKMIDRISTRGAIDDVDGELPDFKNMREISEEARFLRFKDYDSWKVAAERYGNGDMFGTMMAHLEQRAKIISMMEILGPKPEYQWSWLKAEALRRGEYENGMVDPGALEKAKNELNVAQNMMDQFSGASSQLHGSKLVKEHFVGLSAYVHSTLLGSAAVADLLSKPIMMSFARIMAGHKDWYNIIGGLKYFNPLNAEDRKIAARAGFIVETANDSLARNIATRRIGGQQTLLSHLPSIMSRVSGLTQLSQMGKRMMGLEMMGHFADFKNMSLGDMANGDDLAKGYYGTLKNWGINADEWDLMRSAPLWEPKTGASFMHWREMEKHFLNLAKDENSPITKAEAYILSSRFGDMIMAQANRASPETSLYGKALLQGNSKPGTFVGTSTRAASMYRTWTATNVKYMLETIFYNMDEIGGWEGKVVGTGQMAALLSAFTLTGAIGLQLNAIRDGNTPREDIDSLDFWSNAMLKGGGLGFVGEAFKLASEGDTSAGLATLAGPVGSLVVSGLTVAEDVAGIGLAAMGVEAPKILGHKTHFKDGTPRLGRDAAKFVEKNTPVISNLWYAKAAWNRGMVASLRRIIDPKNEEYWDQYKARLARHGQEMYLEPAFGATEAQYQGDNNLFE